MRGFCLIVATLVVALVCAATPAPAQAGGPCGVGVNGFGGFGGVTINNFGGIRGPRINNFGTRRVVAGGVTINNFNRRVRR